MRAHTRRQLNPNRNPVYLRGSRSARHRNSLIGLLPPQIVQSIPLHTNQRSLAVCLLDMIIGIVLWLLVRLTGVVVFPPPRVQRIAMYLLIVRNLVGHLITLTEGVPLRIIMRRVILAAHLPVAATAETLPIEETADLRRDGLLSLCGLEEWRRFVRRKHNPIK